MRVVISAIFLLGRTHPVFLLDLSLWTPWSAEPHHQDRMKTVTRACFPRWMDPLLMGWDNLLRTVSPPCCQPLLQICAPWEHDNSSQVGCYNNIIRTVFSRQPEVVLLVWFSYINWNIFQLQDFIFPHNSAAFSAKYKRRRINLSWGIWLEEVHAWKWVTKYEHSVHVEHWHSSCTPMDYFNLRYHLSPGSHICPDISPALLESCNKRCRTCERQSYLRYSYLA